MDELRRLEEKSTPGSGLWLHSMTLKWKPHRILPKKDLQDALQLRFNLRPNDLPRACPAKNCRNDFSLGHADSCNIGGTNFRRHDYIKMILANYSEKACGPASTEVEPVLGPLEEAAKEMIDGNKRDQARADIGIQDLNHPHTTTFIDVCVISPVCQSNVGTNVAKTISLAEKKKDSDYKDRVKSN